MIHRAQGRIPVTGTAGTLWANTTDDRENERAAKEFFRECATYGCDRAARFCSNHRDQAPTSKPDGIITLKLTAFEASMLLCVVAVAKGGTSQFDTLDMPIRRRALEHVFARLSGEMCVPAVSEPDA